LNSENEREEEEEEDVDDEVEEEGRYFYCEMEENRTAAD
jgi:hypothetical protein